MSAEASGACVLTEVSCSACVDISSSIQTAHGDIFSTVMATPDLAVWYGME